MYATARAGRRGSRVLTCWPRYVQKSYFLPSFLPNRCIGITSLTLPTNLTTIGPNAFECCIGITSLTLPDTLTSIGNRAFDNCRSIASVTLPSSLTSLGQSAFDHCRKITSLTLYDNLTNIGKYAFRDCVDITSIVFRRPVSRDAFICWVVGSSRNRANWQLTTVKYSRNVLRLITTLAMWSRDVASIDPGGRKGIFSTWRR